MYSGALLATAARLAWDPSTYTWFRFLCAAQYRVSAAYVLAAGLWLAALVYVAAAATAHAHQHQRASRHPQRLHNTTCLHLVSGVVESTVTFWSRDVNTYRPCILVLVFLRTIFKKRSTV